MLFISMADGRRFIAHDDGTPLEPKERALKLVLWPKVRWEYFSFQGGIDAQARDEIEGAWLVARFSNQTRYGRKGRKGLRDGKQ